MEDDIMMSFWFSRNTGLALPIAAIPLNLYKEKKEIKEIMQYFNKLSLEELKNNIIPHNCSICCDENDTENNIIQTKCCKQYYCFECIKEWININNTCPTCRYVFN